MADFQNQKVDARYWEQMAYVQELSRLAARCNDARNDGSPAAIYLEMVLTLHSNLKADFKAKIQERVSAEMKSLNWELTKLDKEYNHFSIFKYANKYEMKNQIIKHHAIRLFDIIYEVLDLFNLQLKRSGVQVGYEGLPPQVLEEIRKKSKLPRSKKLAPGEVEGITESYEE